MEGIIGAFILGCIVGGWVAVKLYILWNRRPSRKKQSTAPGVMIGRRLVDGQGNEVRLRLPLDERKLLQLAAMVNRGCKLTVDNLDRLTDITYTDWKRTRPILIHRGCLERSGNRGEVRPTGRLIAVLKEELSVNEINQNKVKRLK